VVNSFATAHEFKKWASQMERDLAPLEGWPGPTIVALKLEVDIRPMEVTATASGTLTLKNRTNRPLTQFILNHGSVFLESASMPGANLKEEIKDYGIAVWTFTKPLQPGEKRDLTFKSAIDGKTVASNDLPTAIVSNGSFIESSQLVPSIRIDRDSWLSDLNERQKFGLPEKRPLPQVMLDENYYTPGSGWVEADITVSTDVGQIPVAPGILVRETITDGRVTRQFRPPVSINNLFAIQSANYVVKREQIQLDNGPVELEIYHLPGFTRNLTAIMTAMRTSLQTFSKLYGPYPFGVLRIVQTPSYGAVDIAAQAYAGTVPFYEDGGWLQIIDPSNKSDELSQITAHEVAHMWWGHQIVPSMHPGALVLTEGLAEMTSWIALAKLFPQEAVRAHLVPAKSTYEFYRGKETTGEPTLSNMETQRYLAYGKAPIALFTMREAMGPTSFDAALGSFFMRYTSADRPYPTIEDLLDTLKSAAGPELHLLIEQLFDDRVRWNTEISHFQATQPIKSRSTISLTAWAWTENLDELGKPYTSAGIGVAPVTFSRGVACGEKKPEKIKDSIIVTDKDTQKGECYTSEQVAVVKRYFKRTPTEFKLELKTPYWVDSVQVGDAIRSRQGQAINSQSLYPPNALIPSYNSK
jgi:hypothetical protein